jgi:iron complex transport system permease protein
MDIEPVTPGRVIAAVGICAALCAVAMISMPLLGSAHIDFGRALRGQSPDAEILFRTRVPRILLAALAGGGLAFAGVLFQALLRDALADPHIIGVSSGASLGAVTAICAGWQSVGALPAVWVAAFLGAAGTLLLILSIASEGRRISSFTLLLSGVTVTTTCFGLILLLQSVANFSQSFAIVHWLMGSIEIVDGKTLVWLAAASLAVCAYGIARGRDWNLLSIGEEWAATRGVATNRLMLAGFLAGSFLVGTITSITGPIGFVGLIIPHALRLRMGADHRLLLPCSFFLGAGFLVVCDTLARTVMAPTEIPVGVVTSVLGGPYFIWFLRSNRRKWNKL